MLKVVTAAAAASVLVVALPIAVAQQPAPAAPAPGAGGAGQASIWDRVYSATQATRGQTTYSANCAKCHGRTGNGAGEPDQPESPAIARDAFLREWEGKTVAELFELVRTTMPHDNPKSRTDQEYIDSIAHMFRLSNLPAGANDLPPDPAALARIVIKRMP
jgi:cytochrome c